MSRASTDCHLEAEVEALRRELAEVIAMLSNAGRRLEDLAEKLRSRHHADKVVALDRRRRDKDGHDPDILADFLE
jgi:uncharacterized membrane protein